MGGRCPYSCCFVGVVTPKSNISPPLDYYHYQSYIWIFKPITNQRITPVGWRAAVEYTDYISAGGGGKTLPTSVIDMKLNNLMVRF